MRSGDAPRIGSRRKQLTAEASESHVVNPDVDAELCSIVNVNGRTNAGEASALQVNLVTNEDLGAFVTTSQPDELPTDADFTDLVVTLLRREAAVGNGAEGMEGG